MEARNSGRILSARWVKNVVKVVCVVCTVILVLVAWDQVPSKVPMHKVESRDLVELDSRIYPEVNLSVLLQTGTGTLLTVKAFPLVAQRPDRIFFNRIPKCGTNAIKYVFRFLSQLNKWKLVSSRVFNRERINSTQQADLVLKVSSLPPPVVFERHVHFVNFTKHGAAMPFYINVVRDPLERLVSDYYFLRHHLKQEYPMSVEDRSRTYDECVRLNRSECLEPGPRGYYRIVPFFCGQHPFCRTPSWESVSEAKRTVEKHYALVGVSEDLGRFFGVLERLAPGYFSGAEALYRASEQKIKQKYKTRKKIPPNNSTVATMKQKLAYDYDFYYFVKRKFYTTWREGTLKRDGG